MPVPIQQGWITRGLQALFRIKGRFQPALDNVVVPTVITDDLSVSPYLRPPKRWIHEASIPASGAGEHGITFVTPQQDTILVVRGFCVEDPASIGPLTAMLVWLSAADQAGVTVIGSVPLNDANGLTRPGPNIPRIASTRTNAHNTGLVGTRLKQVSVRLDETLDSDIGWGFAVRGNDPEGIPAVGIICATANQEMRASLWGDAYDIEG